MVQPAHFHPSVIRRHPDTMTYPHDHDLAAARQRFIDRRMRRFMASHGYPDPDTIRSERTIWQGASGQIHTSRVCSTSSAGTVVVTSPEIRQIVAEAYARSLHLPQQWSPAQREAFLEAEAAKISYQVAELAAEMGAQAVGEWTRNRGQHPDYLTKRGAAEHRPQPGDGDRAAQRALRADPVRAGPAEQSVGRGPAGARSQSAALGAPLDPTALSQRPQPGHRGPDRGACGRTRITRRCFGSRPDTC